MPETSEYEGQVGKEGRPDETGKSDAPQGGEKISGSSSGNNPAGNTGESELDALREQVRKLEDENSDLKDQYLRKQADFENFRKRMFREKEESVKFSNSQLILDLIAIIDDFERAIKSSEESKDFEAFHSGIVLIEKQFTNMLERKWGLSRFDSEGEQFDPQKHEAISMESSSEYDTSRVIEDFQKGYYLNDRVLRPAKVKVAMPIQESAPAAEQRDEEQTS